MMPEPTAPPNAAFAVKAHSKMSTSASQRYAQFSIRMIRQPSAYPIAMIGTKRSHTSEMIRTPPKMTTATRRTMITPMIHGAISIPLEVMMPVIADACTAEPVPIAAMAAKSANATAPKRANHGVVPFFMNPRCQAYIAPPNMFPL